MSRTLAAVEGVAALALLPTLSSACTRFAPSADRAVVVATSFFGLSAATYLLYGRRLRLAGRATWSSLLSWRPTGRMSALVAAQVALLAGYIAAAMLRDASPFACWNVADLLWGVLYEEALYRVALLYVTLQRSGGAASFAAATSAAAFAAVHAGALLFAAAPPPLLLGSLQVALAAAAGNAYAFEVAATGSIGVVIAAHILNNGAALTWLPLSAALEGRAQGEECTLRQSGALMGLVAAQLALYVWVAVGAARAAGQLSTAQLAALHPAVASTVAAAVLPEAAKKTD
jgi:membrane protease YdiL (CAAX protease family)